MEFAFSRCGGRKPREPMTPSKRKEFFYARLYPGDVRRRIWDWRTILGIGVCCGTGRGVFSFEHARGERHGIFRYRIPCRINGFDGAVASITAAPRILHDRRMRRL